MIDNSKFTKTARIAFENDLPGMREKKIQMNTILYSTYLRMYFLSISWMSRANGQEDDQRESLSRYIVDKAILKKKRLVTRQK